jgi:iron complex outermembrane receptor protein
MKRKNLLVLLSIGIALTAPAWLAAQTATGAPSSATRQSTGTITGRVRNVVTGQYLNKARVAVKGTDQVVYTDNFGIYQLVEVRSGPVVLEVFYTDLDVALVPIEVPTGGRIEHNVELTSVGRYGQNLAVVNLDPFVVSSDRETDAKAIATNEQRFAANIKNVMATDSLGDVLNSSVGDFLKFMPGLTVEFDNADIVGVSIRGVGGSLTAVTMDGAPGSAVWFGSTRSVDIRSMALNDVARMEVTKVPTPSSPADALAGSVNMVSKSAFERSGALLRYGVNLGGNHEDITLKKTPQSFGDRKSYKMLPGFDFDYTRPIGKNFGIVVAGMYSNKFNEQHTSRMTYATTGTGISTAPSRPYLQSYFLNDGPRNLTRKTMSFKADWRVTPSSVLSVGGQWVRAKTEIGALRLTISAGTNGTPTPATGGPMSFSDNFTIGATGRGAYTMDAQGQNIDQGTTAGNLNYRFDDGKWRIEATLSRSVSTITRRNELTGNFFQLAATAIKPIRVSFLEANAERPGNVRLYDVDNQLVDYHNIENFRGTNGSDTPTDNVAKIGTANLNLRRRLGIFSFPTALQVGGAIRRHSQDLKPESKTWTFNGPDGNAATIETLAPYTMQVYKNQDAYFGFKNIPWVSTSRAWSAWQANPALFTQTAAQVVTQENYRRTNSEYVQETVSAGYVQAEAGLFGNRLRLLTGVRFEKTQDEGLGSLSDPAAVFQRNPNGSFVRNAAGNQVRKPEAGTAGSIEELRLIVQERTARASRTYDGYYPSFHLTYAVRENLLARAAYAKTYGRPDFTEIIPRATINESNLSAEQLEDPTIVRGTITVRNMGLRPWSADNYDLSLEYYTQQGGLFSAGVFLKEIKDFFGNAVKLATASDLVEVGLDSRYVGWNLSTKFNSGDARVSGVEFNLRQSLREFGRWGSYFTVFANATKLELQGNREASFTSFIPKSGNWGATFNRKQVTLTTRWNYRGQDRRSAQLQFGPDGFEYYRARTTLDVNLGYQLTRRLALAASINNLFNEPLVLLRYGADTPAYARQYQTQYFGVQFAVGLKGTY